MACSTPQPAALQDRGETAMHGRKGFDPAFFQRVAHSNRAQIDLMQSSMTKLAESLRLLDQISDLLRR